MSLLGIEQGIISFLEPFMLHKSANADLKLLGGRLMEPTELMKFAPSSNSWLPT